MTPAKAAASFLCAVMGLLSASCVETLPEQGYDVPPAPPLAASAPSYPGPYDQLVAPIALYPDPLIALILPAAAQPREISAAAAFLIRYGDPTQIESQPWDPAVRALAHYPAVVNWMAQNPAWTQALGEAFASDPGAVMDGVQRMRAKALASGALVSTAQQEVYQDGGNIEIYPAQPDALYVPVYDDSVVYSDSPYYGYGGPFMNFGDPYPEGPWLSFYFDWGRHRVWAGDRGVWQARSGWRPPRTGGDRPPKGSHAWVPPHEMGHTHARQAGPGAAPAPAPRPRAGAPAPPPSHYRAPPSSNAAPSHSPARQGTPNQRVAPAGRAQPGTPGQSRPEAHEGQPARNAPPAPGPAPAAESQGRIPPQEARPAQREPGHEAPARGAPPPPPAPRQQGGQPAPAPRPPAFHYSQPPAPPPPAQETQNREPQK